MKRWHRNVLGGSLAVATFVVALPEVTKALRPAEKGLPGAAPAAGRYESALKASIDPETGKLSNVPEIGNETLTDEERNALDTSDEGLVQVTHADGSVSIDVQGRFQSAAMATIGKDGKLHFACVESPPAAAAILHGADATPLAPVEE